MKIAVAKYAVGNPADFEAFDDNGRHQVAGNHEEHIDADESTGKSG